MIVNVICAAIETFIQMFVCFEIFIRAYNERIYFRKFSKIIIKILFVIWYIFKTRNNIVNLFSISAVLIEIPVMIILFWVVIGKDFTRIVAWSCFSTTTVILIKFPTLITIGLIYNKSLSDMNLINNSQTWSRVVNCLIFIFLFLLYIAKRDLIIKYIKSIIYQRSILLFVSIIEYIIIYYIMCLGWYGFNIQTLILTICLIFILFMIIVFLIILFEYKMIVKINSMLKSKENNMQLNYLLINQEIERNRKINHDKKHDLEFLYYCFEQRDYEKGLNYIKQKENYYNLLQKNQTWTGYGSIDFLINRAKARSNEKKILFTIKVDIVEIPIKEYDFFSVLSNLLDNAIEASMQNKENEGWISVQILSLNNVFKLKMENTYLTEPIMKNKCFVSSKGDNKDHGWGIENVKEIVAKYDGEFNINYGNGIFLVNLIVIK